MNEEEFAMDGLDTDRYSDKWCKAKELALTNERADDARLLPYWERVRLLFLELGGEYAKSIR
jgi:hypothetical protein